MIVVVLAINAYALVVLARIVSSWIPLRAGHPAMPVVRAIHTVTEPPLVAIRTVVPVVRVGAGALDLSAAILLLALWLLATLAGRWA